MELEKIEAKSLQVRVYQRLKNALISSMFEPGQVLVIRELADQLGVSPMPVRQSLHRLVSEHALEEDDRVRSSVRVPELSQEVFSDIISVRMIVEADAAMRAAKNSNRELVNRLKNLNILMARAIEAKDASAVIITNRDFHFELYSAAKSQTLLRTIETLWLQSGPYFRSVVLRSIEQMQAQPKSRRASLKDHEDIIDAVSTSNSQAAAAAIKKDIERSASYFLEKKTTPPKRPRRAQKVKI